MTHTRALIVKLLPALMHPNSTLICTIYIAPIDCFWAWLRFCDVHSRTWFHCWTVTIDAPTQNMTSQLSLQYSWYWCSLSNGHFSLCNTFSSSSSSNAHISWNYYFHHICKISSRDSSCKRVTANDKQNRQLTAMRLPHGAKPSAMRLLTLLLDGAGPSRLQCDCLTGPSRLQCDFLAKQATIRLPDGAKPAAIRPNSVDIIDRSTLVYIYMYV